MLSGNEVANLYWGFLLGSNIISIVITYCARTLGNLFGELHIGKQLHVGNPNIVACSTNEQLLSHRVIDSITSRSVLL